MNFSKDQKQLALQLLSGPKSADELAKQTSLSSGKIATELKELVRLNLVQKQDGFPTRFALQETIAEELKRHQEINRDDKYDLRLHAIIELQAIEPELLKTQADKLQDALKQEPAFTLYSFSQAKTLKQEDWYSTFLDIIISVQDFKSLVRFMYFYGPASIEILKPDQPTFDAHDFQEGLLDMSQMIHAYSNQLTKLLNRTEIESLHRKLYQK